MARLQILELPEGASDQRAPFVLVVDEASFPTVEANQEAEGWWKRLAQQIGAQGCIVTDDTMDIPANETVVDPDGHPVKLRLEPDFTGWDDALTTALARVHDAIGQNFALKIGEMEIGEQALIQTRNGPLPGKVAGRSVAGESTLDELRTMVQEEIAKAQTELVDSLKRGLLR
ncbi:hypothetical protein [Streptomyces sp. NPDC088736]|uniref:hypothetical protein n=1 Tax=Streptomyces sp. NPDC088736 TaxID=3365881 RepID=UPI0037F4B4B1